MSAQPMPSGFSDQAEAAFADLIAEMTDNLQAGQPVDLQQHIARHPEWADRLRDIVPTLEMMAQVSSGAADEVEGNRAAPWQGTLGDFRLMREIGRGGMGVVYEAEQISLGRRVALKVLPFASALDPRQLQRFHNEARAAAGLHHPHIVPIHAVGCERCVHFYAMQFIEGQSLEALLTALRRADSAPAAPPVADQDAATAHAQYPKRAGCPEGETVLGRQGHAKSPCAITQL
jgi:hypothetical protein